jgi:predicted small integral membrane protein
MDIRSFFDLSQPVRLRERHRTPKARRVAVALPAPAALATAAGAIEVGMPAPAPAPAVAAMPSASSANELAWAWQVAIYFILILSIFASRFIDLYRAGVLSGFSVDGPYLVFTAIAALLALPVVYDRAELSRDRPMLVQVGLIFAAGMGWEKLVSTALGK